MFAGSVSDDFSFNTSGLQLWFTAGFGSPWRVWLPPLVWGMFPFGELWRSLWCPLLLSHGQNLSDSHRPLWCPSLIQTWHSLWRFTISQRVCRSLFFVFFCLCLCFCFCFVFLFVCFFLILGMKPVRVILDGTNSSKCSVGPTLSITCSWFSSGVFRFEISYKAWGPPWIWRVICSMRWLLSVFSYLRGIGIATTPANPWSLLIAACRLTNLARSSRAGSSPFSLIKYHTSTH